MKRIGKNVDLPGGSVEKNLPASAGNVVHFLVGEEFHVPRSSEACGTQLLR